MILVTGGVGFIGFHLIKRLLESGETVVGFDNLNDYYDVKLKLDRLEILNKYSNFTFVKGDLSNEKDVFDLFEKYSPEYIVNLGAQAGVRYSLENPRAYIDSNIVGFFNILEACKKHNVKHLIYASSSSVYGANTKVPFSTEDKVDNPVSLYAATKKSNELMAYTYSHLFGINATGLRFFTVYGPWGRPDMAYYSFTNKIIKNEPITVFNNGHMFRDFTYVDDIVEGIVRMIRKTPNFENGAHHKVYNIGNNHTEELNYFIEVLEKVIGKKATINYKPIQPGDVLETYADVSELERDFGYKPNTSIADGLHKFFEWYKEYYKLD